MMEVRKTTSAIEIGDAVRASVGGGLFVHGEVQELRGEECRVRGRWVPLSGVKTEEQIEDEKHEIIRENYRQRAAEQAAKLAADSRRLRRQKKRVFLQAPD